MGIFSNGSGSSSGGGFSRSEIANAKKALQIWESEFSDRGLWRDFDLDPDRINPSKLDSVRRRHLQNIGRLRSSLRQIHTLADILEGLRGRPVVSASPELRRQDRTGVLDTGIDNRMVAFYRNFERALENYLTVLQKRKATGELVDDATFQVSWIINPNAWVVTDYRPLTRDAGNSSYQVARPVGLYLRAVAESR